jgi:uncharacterized membrane protein
MHPVTNGVRAATVVGLVAVVGAAVICGLQPTPSGAAPNQFTIGTAVLFVGYLVFPILALLALGLFLIALMLITGDAIERRRSEDREKD